jgi:hypothetical protein
MDGTRYKLMNVSGVGHTSAILSMCRVSSDIVAAGLTDGSIYLYQVS